GLGYLGAKAHAPALLERLHSPVSERQKASLLHALALMGAHELAREIATLCVGDSCGPELVQAQLDALLVLGARQCAPEIARLLARSPGRGAAAKALAILGANEYGEPIAALLREPEPLLRKDAAIALGLLGDRRHARALQPLLAPEQPDFVRYYAAFA